MRIVFGKALLIKSILLALLWVNCATAAVGEVRACKLVFEVLNSSRLSHAELEVLVSNSVDNIIAPRFTNPAFESRAHRTWKGVAAPRLIQEGLLPAGVNLIPGPLIGAMEPTVVKTASGGMVHLRMNGSTVNGTNVGVSIRAIMANLGRERKSLVSPNATALVTFDHGGGTNTTGHHVAVQILDYLKTQAAEGKSGIEVIAYDQPQHAYGPRDTKANVVGEHMRDEENVSQALGDSNVPAFKVGHSLGGIKADSHRRTIPANETVFSGFIPLSTVADALPGGTTEARLAMETAIEVRNRTNPEIAPGESDLTGMLLRQRKISPTCGIWCDMFTAAMDWMRPSHNGRLWKPALYIIGKGDALYQGFQKSFEEGVAKLNNTELVVYGPRATVKSKKGEKSVIGHLIFDHRVPIDFDPSISEFDRYAVVNGKYMNDKRTGVDPRYNKDKSSEDTLAEIRVLFDQLKQKKLILIEDQFQFEDIGTNETFARVKHFISRVINRPLKRVEYHSEPLEDAVYAYINNLAFRIFAKEHKYVHQSPTQLGTETTERFSQLNKEIQRVERSIKAGKGTLSDDQLAGLNRQLQVLRDERTPLEPIVKNRGVVPPENAQEHARLSEQIDAVRDAIRRIKEPTPLMANRNLPQGIDLLAVHLNSKEEPDLSLSKDRNAEITVQEMRKAGMQIALQLLTKEDATLPEASYLDVAERYANSSILYKYIQELRKVTGHAVVDRTSSKDKVYLAVVSLIAKQTFTMQDLRIFLSGNRSQLTPDVIASLNAAVRSKFSESDLQSLEVLEKRMILFARAWTNFHVVRAKEEFAGRVNLPVQGNSLAPLHQRNHRGEPEFRSIETLIVAYEKAKQSKLAEEKYIGALENYLRSPRLNEIREKREAAYGEMLRQHELVFTATRSYIVSIMKDGKIPEGAFDNLPSSLVAEFEKYGRLNRSYGRLADSFSAVLAEEGAAGRLVLRAVPAKLVEDLQANYSLGGVDTSTVNASARRLKETLDTLRNIKNNLDQRAKLIAYYQRQELKLSLAMIALTGTDHFTTRVYTVQQLLETDPRAIDINRGAAAVQARAELNSILQRIWADWSAVHKNRVIDLTSEGDGLY